MQRCRSPRHQVSDSSVYLDGKVYLLADQSRVLAFDVDDDTVATIDLPGERVEELMMGHAKSELMEMSGRLCVATASGEGSLALWLLTEDQKWERRCLLSRHGAGRLAGGWDCGGVLLLFFQGFATKEPDLILYDTRIDKAFQPRSILYGTKEPRHVFCWGYRPTLVTPRSVAGGEPPPHHGAGVVAALNPVIERDVNAGRKRTLETVCFMDTLLHIMRQLPDKANDIAREYSRDHCHSLCDDLITV
ncbi:hypothetical protein PVAP13_7NG023900 [Panicum virgatum]|uniref:F-box associated domain-containing protein n=1 Tax=Panicum virgatum TaxID=38727 RepID=A0A8T0Q0I3_PANVG|nr:hypothetical protein PVAP13_7NG023900 [Panicum virgatum]